MSSSWHAAAPDQLRAPAAPRRSPTGYHAVAAPGAAMVHPVEHEQFAEAFPANANRISLLDEEQLGVAVRAVLEETICRPALLGRTPPRSSRYEQIDRFLICSWVLSYCSVSCFVVCAVLEKCLWFIYRHDRVEVVLVQAHMASFSIAIDIALPLLGSAIRKCSFTMPAAATRSSVSPSESSSDDNMSTLS
jgi:hypothetical protein